MFSNAYQNGSYFQIFDSKANNEKNLVYKQLCKITPNTIKKQFDKQIKSYLYEFNAHNARIAFPADDHKQLSLHQRFLVLQIYIPVGSSWSMEIGITDIAKIKRRINITTNSGKQQTKYFSLRYPVLNIIKGTWLYLGIDVLSFMDAFKGQVFRSLDHISIGSTCKLRRVFTLKQWNQFDIPKGYWLPAEVQQNIQLIQHGQKKIETMISSQVAQRSRIRQQKLKEDKTPKKQQKILLNSPMKKSHVITSLHTQESTIRPKKNKNNVDVKNQLSPQSHKLKLNTYIQRQKRQIKKLQKQHQHLKTKGPIIDKSFQEDQALNVPPQQSDLQEQSQQVSIRKIQNHSQQIQQDRWSQNQTPLQTQTNTTPFTQLFAQSRNQFPTTTISKQNNVPVIIQKKQQNQLQLIYDQMVGCYYHPETNTYYEINE